MGVVSTFRSGPSEDKTELSMNRQLTSADWQPSPSVTWAAVAASLTTRTSKPSSTSSRMWFPAQWLADMPARMTRSIPLLRNCSTRSLVSACASPSSGPFKSRVFGELTVVLKGSEIPERIGGALLVVRQ